MKKLPRITSSKQALAESMGLESCWSRETMLTQRILIYQTELMERMLNSPLNKKRKLSHWPSV